MIVSVSDKYRHRELITSWILRGGWERRDGRYQFSDDHCSSIEKLLKWDSWGIQIDNHTLFILIPQTSVDLEIPEGISFREYQVWDDEGNLVETKIRTWGEMIQKSALDGSKHIGYFNQHQGTIDDLKLLSTYQEVTMLTSFQYRLEVNSEDWQIFDEENVYSPTLSPTLLDSKWDMYFDDILQARDEMRNMHKEGVAFDSDIGLKWEVVAPADAVEFQRAVDLRDDIEMTHKPVARRRRIRMLKDITSLYLPMTDIERLMPYFMEVADKFYITGAIGTEYINYHTGLADPEGILDFANGTADYAPSGTKPSVQTLIEDGDAEIVAQAYRDIILKGIY